MAVLAHPDSTGVADVDTDHRGRRHHASDGVWNDYLLGLVFAGRDNLPMTVQLNNVINTTTGTREYNVNMAATMLTSLVPWCLYFVSGRWFQGITAGAVSE